MRNAGKMIREIAPNHVFHGRKTIYPTRAVRGCAGGQIDGGTRSGCAIRKFQPITAKSAINAVIAAKAVEAVGNIITNQRIVKAGRSYTLNTNQRIRATPAIRRPFRHQVNRNTTCDGAIIAKNHIVAHPVCAGAGINQVAAHAAVKNIIPGAANQRIGPGTGVNRLHIGEAIGTALAIICHTGYQIGTDSGCGG